jgi:hypothetical protein
LQRGVRVCLFNTPRAASIVIWSFCNEAGCEGSNEAGGPSFQQITYEYDGSRPTLANMFTYGDLLGNTIDVQGFSHQSRSQVDALHHDFPDKAQFMSECCSCTTQRGEDTSGSNYDSNFNADCLESQTNTSNGVPYVSGTMVRLLLCIHVCDISSSPCLTGLDALRLLR